MHVPGHDINIGKIFCQVFCHPFGKRGYQHSFLLVNCMPDLTYQIVYLPLHRPYHYFRVNQTCGPDDLLYYTAAVFQFEFAGCGRDKYSLLYMIMEFIYTQRPVVICTGQPETVRNQCILPGTVTIVHPLYLGQGNMTFIQNHYIIIRKEIQQ